MIRDTKLALKITAFIIEWAKALGRSRHLCSDIYQEMDESRPLFYRAGIYIPRRVTKTQEVYFSKLKEPVQELAVQFTNILRYHEDAEEIARYIMNTKLTNGLTAETFQQAQEMVKTIAAEFELDADNFPIRQAQVSNCVMDAFDRHGMFYMFVRDMDEFWATPTPYNSKTADFGLRANSKAFRQEIFRRNILLAI